MPRPRKEGQYLNVKIDLDLYHELVEVSDEAGQSKTTVVERALTMYFDDYKKKQEILRKAAEEEAERTEE